MLDFTYRGSRSYRRAVSRLSQLDQDLSTLSQTGTNCTSLRTGLALRGCSLSQIVKALRAARQRLTHLSHRLLRICRGTPCTIHRTCRRRDRHVRGLAASSFSCTTLHDRVYGTVPSAPKLSSICRVLRFQLPRHHIRIKVAVLQKLRQIADTIYFLSRATEVISIIGRLFCRRRRTEIGTVGQRLSGRLRALVFTRDSLHSVSRRHRTTSSRVCQVVGQRVCGGASSSVTTVVSTGRAPDPRTVISVLRRLGA